MNIAVITAREGSTRLPDKHTRCVAGRHLMDYPILAAQNAIHVDHVYLATDSELLTQLAEAMGVNVLHLPPEHADDAASHAQALLWAVTHLDGRIEFDNVVILPGNTVMIDAATIDRALEMLNARPEIDSVMTVWQAEDDHPNRALIINERGFLRNMPADAPTRSNVQEYAPVYYQDQGLWAFRRLCIYRQEGPAPWNWVGTRCAPLLRPWWAGRDVDVEFDLEIAEHWVRKHGHRRDAKSAENDSK